MMFRKWAVALAAAAVFACALSGCSVEWGQTPARGTKVSELPRAHALDGSETIMIVQDGRSVQVRLADIASSSKGVAK